MFRFISLFILAVLPLNLSAKVGTTELATGFKKAVWAESPIGVKDYLWVVEKEGTIRILNRKNGKKSDFLDIKDLIKIKMNEQGLLGFAFSKDYLQSGRFYVYYTNTEGNTEICRFIAHGAGMRKCNASTRELLLTFNQNARNHNGGWIGIGPDGYLYIAAGDGGSGNDPKAHGQDLSTHLGKLLRIDVSPKKGYRIPADNPFKNQSKAKPEIYAYGLRNPWRCSWDRKTKDFFIGDVGQNLMEEINYMPAGKGNGANYGWRLREGNVATPKKGVGGPKPKGVIDPIYTYKRGGGKTQGVSVTGGYVYRGPIKSLQGKYFFADFANPRIWSFEVSHGKMTKFEDWTDRFKPENGKIKTIASFGEDSDGNLLIISLSGSIYQVVDK
ncbi:MAG: PQQ-dependent sugar dehydrogenase [Akkermansiaceae bacterium]|jgi:glucose/arabinose dehydrogenase|tara:strand:- start:21611 stop:22765 length:1155 start_codon:yes stop_codon:yes gene_type:complete